MSTSNAIESSQMVAVNDSCSCNSPLHQQSVIEHNDDSPSNKYDDIFDASPPTLKRTVASCWSYSPHDDDDSGIQHLDEYSNQMRSVPSNWYLLATLLPPTSGPYKYSENSSTEEDLFLQ